MLDEIYRQESYKDTLYDCIFVVSGGLGWLYQPNNFKVMKNLLKKDSNGPRVIANLMNKPIFEYPEYTEQFKFMNPINSVLKDTDIGSFPKRDVNECIRNYSKILLGNEFLEMYEMLFRTNKIKLIKTTKKNKLTKTKLTKNK